MRMRDVLLGISAALLITGCTTPTAKEPTVSADSVVSDCAPGPLVSWSSEEAAPSVLTGTTNSDPPKVIAQTNVKGVVSGSVNRARVGSHAYFLSQGDTQHDVTHLIDFDAATCQSHAVRLKNVVAPIALATDGSRFFTTNTINGTTHVRRFDRAGAQAAQRDLAGEVATALVLGPDALYAFVMPSAPSGAAPYGLVIFDLDTLAVRDRKTLPDVTSPVASAVLYGGTLIYPLTADEKTTSARTGLGILDTTGFERATLDLGAELPYLLKLDGDTLYVGHTFINAAFGNVERLRHISRVDLRTRTVTGFEADAGIVDVDARDGQVLLLGWDGTDPDTYLVAAYEGSTGRKVSATIARRFSAGGFYYPAGVLAR